jgi:hypothetical protein
MANSARSNSAKLKRRRAAAVATVENIENAVAILLGDQQCFARFRDAVNGSVAVRQTHFPGLVARWYSQSVLLGLRRLVDTDPRSHSLLSLLNDMLKHPTDWNEEAVIDLWTKDRKPHDLIIAAALEVAYKPLSDAAGKSLNTVRIAADKQTLESSLTRAKRVVNKTIAHSDKHSGAAPTMTFADLDAAVDASHQLVKPYISLLTGRGYNTMVPVEGSNWWRIFDSWSDIPPAKY